MFKIAENPADNLWTVEFSLSGKCGDHACLAGSFSDWDPELLPMNYDEDASEFRCSVQLPGGNYEYKFVLNGEWILDETNPNFSANDFGTLNSILTVG